MSFHIQDIHRNDLNTEDTQKQQQKKAFNSLPTVQINYG